MFSDEAARPLANRPLPASLTLARDIARNVELHTTTYTQPQPQPQRHPHLLHARPAPLSTTLSHPSSQTPHVASNCINAEFLPLRAAIRLGMCPSALYPRAAIYHNHLCPPSTAHARLCSHNTCPPTDLPVSPVPLVHHCRLFSDALLLSLSPVPVLARDAVVANAHPVGMSPVASDGPPHSRSTSVHLGGPISTGRPTRPHGVDTMADAPRVWPHLDDLKRARPNVDINSPLRTIIQEAELCAKLSETQIDFRRPDLALQEHIKATTLVVETLPHHKDYPSLQTDTGDLRRSYIGLQKRINAQRSKIDQAIEIIKENNKRSGVQPTSGRSDSNNERPPGQINGHARSQSVQSPSTTPNYASNIYQNGERSAEIRAASGHTPSSPARKKPPVHPKPDALRGKALHTPISATSPRSPQTELEARFARLRSSAGSTGQDARIQTRPIIIPESLQAPSQSPISARTSAIRPTGPREMPSVPNLVVRPSKISVDVAMPGMPRPPDAIYSPDRNADSLAGLDLPSSAPRGSPYIGSKGQTSAPPISTVGPSPSPSIRKDYFSLFDTAETPGPTKTVSRRPDFALPNTETITAEELEKCFRMATQGLRLLLVDLRSREQFDSGHIWAVSIICVEPFVLRDGMSAEELGDSNVLSPESEQALYEQRQDFDLVVFYDQSSSSIRSGSSVDARYLQNFAKAVYDYGYSKQLKRHPLLLFGGLDAWVDLMGNGSLRTSTTSTAPARKALKPARPLGRVPMARDPPRLQALSRKPRESRPLSKEEENEWVETLRHDTDMSMTDGENYDLEEFSYARTTEDFLRKYPELPSVQESMVSPSQTSMVPSQLNDTVHSVPRPPTRPAPALPRQRSSGISERGQSATYALGPGASTSTITSTPIPLGLTGLDTTGVTCYVNAVLQCLSATKGFRDFLITYRYSTKSLPPKKGAEASDPPQLLTRNLQRVLMSLWCGQYEWVTPKTLWVCAVNIPLC